MGDPGGIERRAWWAGAAWALPLLVVVPMLALASALGTHEIIFPEGAALAMGIWVVGPPGWSASRRRVALLPALFAAGGVLLLRLGLAPATTAILAVTLAALGLQAIGTRLAPALSAGVLPIVFEVHAWSYPVAVLAVSLVVAANSLVGVSRRSNTQTWVASSCRARTGPGSSPRSRTPLRARREHRRVRPVLDASDRRALLPARRLSPRRPAGDARRARAALRRQVGRPFGMEWRFTDPGVPKRAAIMVSRYDHCLLDLPWRARREELDLDIGLVISNHADLAGDVRSFGVPFVHIPVSRDTKAEAERRQIELLAGNVDLIVMARYMQILSAEFLEAVGVPVINIHHSFLPSFAGAGPHARAHDRGVKLIGATAHYATEHLDEGPIIEQDRRARHPPRQRRGSSSAAALTSSARSSPAPRSGTARTASCATASAPSSSDAHVSRPAVRQP